MRHILISLLALFVCSRAAEAQGLLIPKEAKLPPLSLVKHDVKVAIEDQVAVTTVEQTFHNSLPRELEATYRFPVPKGASVRKFSMWINGKEEKGELLEAKQARQIYNDIVRRTMDPGLLEYVGNDLLQVRVFPVPANGDQKISLSFTSLASSEGGLVEYLYPLKTDTKARPAGSFSLQVSLKSQHPIQNIYSPSHHIAVTRNKDKEAVVVFESNQPFVSRDFQLFFSSVAKDVGLTALMHRPIGDTGYFLMLISPRAELARAQEVPRDMVFVLDTSGSMQGNRIKQARAALKFCLTRLGANDRFGVIQFATTVNKYTNDLKDATQPNIAEAHRWVDTLQATGATAIDDALQTALQMRPAGDNSRPFTIVFFTDGQPTIGEEKPDKILANVLAKNTANTRIFAFGVGDDVNAVLLDQLAEKTRAVSTYVRENEDIEAKVSSLYAKISSPVLTDLKLTAGDAVKLLDIYPPQLPDLFSGTQLVVLGRYQGKGKVQIKLTGLVGKEQRVFIHDLDFAERTGEERSFVEDLWARRKVGFLLDQVRLHGERKELVDEVITLAKRHGITTPYTSYLVLPESPRITVEGKRVVPGGLGGGAGGKKGGGKKGADKVEDFAKGIAGDAKKAEQIRKDLAKDAAKDGDKKAADELARLSTFDSAKKALAQKQLNGIQQGALGVDVAVLVSNLRNQQQLTTTAVQRVANRSLVDVGGVWIDEGFDAKMKIVSVKAQSDAYFRLLDRQPGMAAVLRLGNHLVYVTPSGDALIIDAEGAETLPDADIDRLFVAPKKK